MDLETIRQRLADLDAALDEGRYRKGMWQRLLRDAARLPSGDKPAIAGMLDIVSRKLHGRNGYPRAPFSVAFIAEIVLLAAGVALLSSPSSMLILPGTAAIAVSLQPTTKVVAGLLLGVRYDYAFLWYIEPRFKMRYGTYFLLGPARRVLFHLAGSIGTPIAMYVGFACLSDISPILAYVCLAFAAVALLMQVGAFLAQWMGVDRVAGFRLATLTSPATAAFELKQLLDRAGR